MTSVQENESAAVIIEDGDITYLCYPRHDVPVGGTTVEGWAVQKIDESTPGTTVITWANGNNLKNNPINSVGTLTYKYL